MNQTLVYRLKPRSPFHLGERGVGIEATEDIIHSDTLFSALCCAIAETQSSKALLDFLDAFKQSNPPFLLSSLFPYIGDTLFFPKPMLLPKLDGELMEKYRNIRFLSQKIWEAFIKGEDLTLKEDHLLNRGTLWVSESEKKGLLKSLDNKTLLFWSKSITPRVTIDRISSTSLIYHAGRVTFTPDCGLHFLVQFRDNSLRSLMEDALQYLADAGLGGERSCGYGQFKPLQPQPFSLPQGESSTFLTLSLYSPTQQELSAGLLKSSASYEIIERRGWIYSAAYAGKYRKSLRMLAEGSVLSGSAQQIYGQLVNVTPEIKPQPHPIYRYGFGFPVPINQL